MVKFSTAITILMLAVILLVVSAPGYAVTDKVILQIEGMT